MEGAELSFFLIPCSRFSVRQFGFGVQVKQMGGALGPGAR
jgi:hypothetical protein